jgi:hypothetical protein
VTDLKGKDELQAEFSLLTELGAEGIKWMNEQEVVAEHGAVAGFVAGIEFPNDAIVNSSEVIPHRSIFNDYFMYTDKTIYFLALFANS